MLISGKRNPGSKKTNPGHVKYLNDDAQRISRFESILPNEPRQRSAVRCICQSINDMPIQCRHVLAKELRKIGRKERPRYARGFPQAWIRDAMPKAATQGHIRPTITWVTRRQERGGYEAAHHECNISRSCQCQRAQRQGLGSYLNTCEEP